MGFQKVPLSPDKHKHHCRIYHKNAISETCIRDILNTLVDISSCQNVTEEADESGDCG